MAAEKGESHQVSHYKVGAHTYRPHVQGEVVEEGRMVETSCYNTVEVGFRDSGRRQFSLNLYYNEEAKPPTRKTSGKPLHPIRLRAKHY